MSGRPTSEHLVQRIRELEYEIEGYKKREDDLKICEKKYDALIEVASDWVNEVDTEGVYTYVNPKIKSVLGYPPDEVVGRTIFDFPPEEEVQHARDFFKATIAAQEPFSGFVSTHIRKDGRRIMLETNGAPFLNLSGELIGYWGLGRDVTKRTKSAEDLRKSNERWRSLVENNPNVVLILDREGAIQFINRTVAGYSAEQVIGRNFLEYIENQYHTTVREAIDTVFKSGKPGQYTIRGTGPNGIAFWYETQVGPLENKGIVFAVMLIVTDITKRKEVEASLRSSQEETEKQVRERTAELQRANVALQVEITERKRVEKSLQESEKRFRSLVEAISDMVWEIDLNGRYTYVSPKAKDLLGYQPEEIIGETPFEWMSEKDEKHSLELLASVREKKVPFQGHESTVIRKDGRRIHLETSGAPVLDADGNLKGFRGIDKDITERVRSREQMFQAAKMVSLGTLVSGVAHEINNPITSIMLNSPILHKIWNDITPVLDEYCQMHGDIRMGNATYTQLGKRVPVLLSDITEGSKRVKRIVDELKNFAQQRPFNLSDRVDLNKTVKTAVGLVSNLIKKATNNFEVGYGENLPIFKGNAQRIEQVAINLIINACEALPDKEHTVGVSTAYDANSDSVVIKVRDQGRGMSSNVLERIGDPFFTTKRDTGGTGLGLAISKKIIEDHKGTIEFDSVPGEGTLVHIMIPVSRP